MQRPNTKWWFIMFIDMYTWTVISTLVNLIWTQLEHLVSHAMSFQGDAGTIS